MENRISIPIDLFQWIATDEGYAIARAIFLEKSRSLSVRSQNILRKMPGGIEVSGTFVMQLLTITKEEISSFSGCGRMSVKEITSFLQDYREVVTNSIGINTASNTNIDEAEETEEHSDFDIQSLLPQIEELYRGYSVRSTNALKKIILSCDSNVRLLYSYLTNEDFDYKKLKNVGRKSYPEVTEWIKKVKRLVDSHQNKEEPLHLDADPKVQAINDEFPHFIESYHSILEHELDQAPLNIRKAIQHILHINGDSIASFYFYICSPRFSVQDLPNNSASSVLDILSSLSTIKKSIESYARHDKNDIANQEYDRRLSELIVDQSKRHHILLVYKELGYFPFFLAIQEIIDDLDTDSASIFQRSVRYKDGQKLLSLQKVGKELGYSGQWVQYKRGMVIKSFTSKIRQLKQRFSDPKWVYNASLPTLKEDINTSERTGFNADFIYWMLGILHDDLLCKGDVYKVLTSNPSDSNYLFIVPTLLNKSFDYKKFIQNIESLYSSERCDNEIVCLSSIVSSCLKQRTIPPEISEITKLCIRILREHYDLTVEHDYIVFLANKKKPLLTIVYEILKESNSPLTLDEIAERLRMQHPDRVVSLSSLSTKILRDSKVMPVGRSGLYTLSDWNNDERRGGTIRGFVCEYLDSLNKPTAPIEAIIKHVQQYRPSSSERSIISNLMQESSHRFVILQKRGKRYISYSDYSHGPAYINISGDSSSRRSRQESMSLLEAFILANQRFPQYKSEDMEEKRLCRFYYNSRQLLKNGQLSEDEAEAFRLFEEKYASFSAKDDKLNS